jgi:hypothetical protein
MGCSTHRLGRLGWLALLLISGVALSVPGKEFWESKPFTQWTEEDAMKMLADSPWTRTVSVLAGTLGIEQTAQWPKDLPSLSTTGTGRETSSLVGMAGKISYGTTDFAPVYISWLSSGKIRQALGRLAQLRNQVPEAQVKKLLDQPPGDYQIAIFGPLMGCFNAVSLEDLKEKTYLISKKDKSKKIYLKGYTAPKDHSDSMAVFSFERQLNGKPAFGLEDQEVQFDAQGKKVFLKTSFKLTKMVDAADLDL